MSNQRKALTCDCKLCIYYIACNIIEEIKREMTTYGDTGFIYACDIIMKLEYAIKCIGEPVRVSHE